MKDRNSSLDIPLLAITILAAATKQVPSDSILLYIALGHSAGAAFADWFNDESCIAWALRCMHMIVYTYDPFKSDLFAPSISFDCLKFVLSNDLLNTRNSSITVLVLVDNIAFESAQTRCRRRPSYRIIWYTPNAENIVPIRFVIRSGEVTIDISY